MIKHTINLIFLSVLYRLYTFNFYILQVMASNELIRIGTLFKVVYTKTLEDKNFHDVILLSSTGKSFGINRTVLSCTSQVCCDILLDLYKCPIANSDHCVHISTNLSNDELCIMTKFFVSGELPTVKETQQVDLQYCGVFTTFGINLQFIADSLRKLHDKGIKEEETDFEMKDESLKVELEATWDYRKRTNVEDVTDKIVKRRKDSEKSQISCQFTVPTKSQMSQYLPYSPPVVAGLSKMQSVLFHFPQDGERNLDMKYQCGRCTRSFNALPDYRQHFMRHNLAQPNPKQSFSCVFCFDFTCSSNSELERHRKDDCIVEKYDDDESVITYFCAFCDNSGTNFDTLQLLIKHLADIHPEKERALFRPFMCAACGTGYQEQKDLARHCKGEGPYHFARCIICDLEVESWDEHKKHVNEQHGGNFRYKCGLCGACAFDTMEQMKYHRKFCKHIKYAECPLTENPKIALCTICSCEVDGSVFHVRKHFSECHPEQLHTCASCGKGFSSERLVRLHIARDHERSQEDYCCQLCDKSFRLKSSLKIHQLSVHSSDAQKPFKCAECGSAFGSKGSWKTHMKTHVKGDVPSQKLRVCEICGTSVTERGYSKHMNRMHGDMILPCDQCDQVFKHIAPLNAHKRSMHTFVTCEVCGEVVKGGKYRSHKIRRHTSIENMPFTCNICNPPKGFASRNDYNDHNNIHTGERPYHCAFCSRSFTNASNRSKHVKQAHKEECHQAKQKLNMEPLPTQISTVAQ